MGPGFKLLCTIGLGNQSLVQTGPVCLPVRTRMQQKQFSVASPVYLEIGLIGSTLRRSIVRRMIFSGW